MTTTIGKCKVDVRARGCIDCGAQFSSGWTVAQTAKVTIESSSGSKTIELDVHRCASCQTDIEPKETNNDN